MNCRHSKTSLVHRLFSQSIRLLLVDHLLGGDGINVRVKEEKLLVGGKSPKVGRDDLLSGIADGTDVDHGLQAEDTSELALLVGGVGGMDLGHGILDGTDGSLELREGSNTSGLDRGNDVLVEHVHHGEGLHLDGASVVVVEDNLTSLALLLGHNVHLLKELGVLLRGEGVDGLDARVDSPQTAVGELLLGSVAVVVTVEDDAPVLVQGLTGNIDGRLSGINAIRELAELLGDDGVEDGVDHRHVLGRTDGTELETSSTIGEGGGTVAVLGGDLEGEDLAGSEVEGLDTGDVLALALAILEVLKVEGHVLAEVARDDGGGSLAGTETEVVAGGGDGHAHEISVLVHGGDHGGHDDGEGGLVVAGSVDGAGLEELDAVGGGKGPVVVLTGSVDVVEGLLLEEGGQAVAGGNLLDDLHDHEVLVDLGGVGAEEGGELELVGGDLTVAGLEGDTELEALVLDLLHAGEGGGGRGEGGHVVIAHLLTAGGVLAHDGAAGELKIGALVVGLTGDEEDLLLQTDVGTKAVRDVEAKVLQEAAALLVEGGVGAEEGGLLIEGGAVVRDEGGGDEHGVAAEEDGGGGVDGEVSASAVSAAEATVGVGGAIGFSLDEVLALEVELNLVVGVEGEHLVLDLTGLAVTDAGGGHGLEPVAEGVGTIVGGPVSDNADEAIDQRKRRIMCQLEGSN